MEVNHFIQSKQFLKKQIEEIKSTIAKIKRINSNVRHRGVERVNKVACFEVEIKHTNEFMISFGSQYKAEVTAQQALKILQMRLQNFNDKLAKSESLISQNTKKTQKLQKVGKQSIVKLQDGKSGMLKVIGNQNGEDIFNIVEFQSEQKPTQNLFQQRNINQNRQPETIVQEKSKITEQDLQDDEQIEQQTNQIEDDYEPQEGEQSDFMQQIRYRQIKVNQEKQKIKTSLPTIIEQPKQKQKSVAVENIVKEVKEVKQKKRVVLPKQAQKQSLPVKISKFKLQKMKQKLQKQLH